MHLIIIKISRNKERFIINGLYNIACIYLYEIIIDKELLNCFHWENVHYNMMDR